MKYLFIDEWKMFYFGYPALLEARALQPKEVSLASVLIALNVII